jgi:hypothetical protein
MKKHKKQIRILLLIIFIIIGSTTFLKYQIISYESYIIGLNDFAIDGSFENYELISPGDCCKTKLGQPEIFGSITNFTSSLGNSSLNLTSKNHCACISRKIDNFNAENIYYITASYKGDNPRIGIHLFGPESHLIEKKFGVSNSEWKIFQQVITFSDSTQDTVINLYADSDGTKTVTNYYDNIRVRKLIAIDNNYNFQNDTKYIIKTKEDNNVNGEIISEIKNGEAYFLIEGKPKVTIKFPLIELIIILIILLIIGRLNKT